MIRTEPTTRSETLRVVSGGTSFEAVVVMPADNSQPLAGVFLVPEAYGANAHNRELAERFARAGYAAMLPDLYYFRDGPWQAYDYSESEHVVAIRDAMNHEVVLADLYAALEVFAGLPDVDAGRMALCGFSIGGCLAHVAASRDAIQVRAAAFFYQGAGPDGPIPRCPTIGFSPDRVSPASLEQLDSRLRQSSSHEHEMYLSGDAQYGFLRHGAPSFHYGAAADSWHRLMTSFERHLNPTGSRTIATAAGHSS